VFRDNIVGSVEVEKAVFFHTLSPFPKLRASLLVSGPFANAGLLSGERERLERSLGFSFPGDSEYFASLLSLLGHSLAKFPIP
jgi:hypothetical protein